MAAKYPSAAPTLETGITDASPATPNVHSGYHDDLAFEVNAIGTDLVSARGATSSVAAKIAAMDSTISAKESSANKGAASGYAPLNSSSIVPLANLPVGLGGTLGSYGAFYDTTSQTNIGGPSAYNTISYNTTAETNGITVVSGTKITFGSAGTYDIQFSAQLDKSDAGDDTFEIWFALNGTDIPQSNGLVTLHGNDAKALPAWNFVTTVNAEDYIELRWFSADTALRLLAVAAGTSPTRPAIPSVILTVAQIMYTQLGPTGPAGPAGSVMTVTGTAPIVSSGGASPAISVTTGTTSATVAIGDDSRITGAAQKSSNLSDLASSATARTNLGLGTAAVKDIPATGDATSAQVVYGTDTRLSDARTPTAHVQGASTITTGTLDIARIPTGITSATVTVGNDSRLSDSRTPTGSAGGSLSGTYPSPTVVSTSLSSPLPIAQGGTAASTLPTGILKGAGAGAITAVAAPTGTIVGTSDTQTLTNKRVTSRVSTATSAASPTINTDNTDVFGLTAQPSATAIASFTTNLSGTPNDGDKLWIYIVATGTCSITWGAKFEASTALLPTTTVGTDRLDIGFVYNTVSAKWRCVAYA